MTNIINIPLKAKSEKIEKDFVINVGDFSFEATIDETEFEQGALILSDIGGINTSEFSPRAMQEDLQKGLDLLLGEGAFEDIHSATSSLVECGEIFANIIKQISPQFDKRTQVEKAQDFVKLKKRRR